MKTYTQCPYCQRVIMTESRQRTTGAYSQNHHINGHAQQLARGTGQDFSYIKMQAKFRAISRGWLYDIVEIDRKFIPSEILFMDVNNISFSQSDTVKAVWPLSEGDSRITTVHAGYLIDELHQMGAESNIELIEGNGYSKFVCQGCLSRHSEHKHHKFSQTKRNRQLYGALLDDPRNIVYLCSVCHLNKPVQKWSEQEFCQTLEIEPKSKSGREHEKETFI